MPKQYTHPTPEQRQHVLTEYGEIQDRLVREPERKRITSICRSTSHKMEKEGRFPARKFIGGNSCAWLLSDLLHWIHNMPDVEKVNSPHNHVAK
ncbi:hypothetical protein SODG_005831 [Sodalis praecaptivus]|nr:AlpA family phage regulatory protein [Sodalis praecaptivus]CAJ0997352.1 hypothetical protein NVIRENTERO_02820 [Sodalis praecaptivus]